MEDLLRQARQRLSGTLIWAADQTLQIMTNSHEIIAVDIGINASHLEVSSDGQRAYVIGNHASGG